jgi:hypothetical protein
MFLNVSPNFLSVPYTGQDNYQRTIMKYYEQGAVPATFAQMREAYLKFGLQAEELPISYSSAPVKVVHDGVPYLLDCYHDLADIPTKAAKFYILLERHHADIKRLHEAWQGLCPDELLVMSGGGLQLQAFFTSKQKYQGILYLSLIDDGRFAELEALLRESNVPFRAYQPDPATFGGPHTLVLGQPWFTTLPDLENIQLRCESTHQYRHPPVDLPE